LLCFIMFCDSLFIITIYGSYYGYVTFRPRRLAPLFVPCRFAPGCFAPVPFHPRPFRLRNLQCAQKCGSNFYTKCHKMALSKSQICSILQHSILEFFQKNMFRRFFKQFLAPICALKFVEMLLEGFSYTLSIMVVN
jgi:hypothetical protein